ncbi:MAG: hypothetical protein U0T32_06250 [Chitinophagales bacterium]
MKKTTIFVTLLVLFLSACKKDATTSNPIAANWTITKWDGSTLTAPEAGTIKFTNTTSTTGTSDFSLTYDGVLFTKETADYSLSANNTVINFTTKTSTNSSPILEGGNPWTINTLNSTTLKLTSKYNLVVEATK